MHHGQQCSSPRSPATAHRRWARPVECSRPPAYRGDGTSVRDTMCIGGSRNDVPYVQKRRSPQVQLTLPPRILPPRILPPRILPPRILHAPCVYPGVALDQGPIQVP
eukprot:5355978-Prymnesium_polylepis.1